MSIEILPTLPAGSPEWLEQRQMRIGGSEVAAVMGLSPWESPFSLWHRKAGLLPVPDISDEEPIIWGNALEPVIRKEFARRNRATHYTRHEVGVTVALDGYALASPDSVVSRKARGSSWGANREVLEIKTSRFGDGWGEPGTDQIPVHYLCQVQWYMGILDLPLAHVAVLVGGSDYREYRVAFDPDGFRLMRDKAAAFTQSIRDGIAPDLDGSYATYEAVRELHPDIDRGEQVELPATLADHLVATKRAKDAADRDYRRASSEVLDLMGSAQHAHHPDGHRVAFRMARGGSTPFLVTDKQALTLQPERPAV